MSADGLQTAVSQRPDRPIADQLAAIASDVASLCQGAARSFDAGTLKQTVVEMERGFLFVMAISDGSLVVLAAMDLLQVARHRRGGGGRPAAGMGILGRPHRLGAGARSRPHRQAGG